TLLPTLLQGFERDVPDREESRLARDECNQVLQVQAEIEVKTGLRALILKSLERFQRSAPLGRNLCQRKIGTPQLRAQRVDTHEDLGDFVVGQRSLQNV